MDSIKEIIQFLNKETRLDLKVVALQHLQGLTGSEDGKSLLIQHPEVLQSLISLTQDNSDVIAKDACLALVNISADEPGARGLLEISEDIDEDPNMSPSNVVAAMMKLVMDPESSLADPACMVLSNLTRPSSNIERVIEMVHGCGFTLDQVVSVFTKQGHNKKGANLHYLGPFFSNLSQSVTFRRYLMDKERCIIQRLFPFTEFEESHVRRGGIVGTLRNCCFDIGYHEWLLSPEIDILPHLLLPLAGPEEYPDDVVDKLPVDLQYLPENKKREDDPDIRKMLLEALLQLCAKRNTREIIRECNTYYILRELHKWEKDRTVLLPCETIVNILLRTEEEIGEENLKDLEVPDELHEEFEKSDDDFVKGKNQMKVVMGGR